VIHQLTNDFKMRKKDNAMVLMIPDIHGRKFWKKAVEDYPDLPVVFLGDYLDPYTWLEDIDEGEALENFKEILDYARANSDRVTLLMGNHDIHYFSEYLNCSRKDEKRAPQICQLLTDNFSLFSMACHYETNGRTFLLSHAGVLVGWMKTYFPSVDLGDADAICRALNGKMDSIATFMPFVFNGLMDVSRYRGGDAEYGSVVWADDTEHLHSSHDLPGIYQIFGHNQQSRFPIIEWNFACIDVRCAFVLTTEGTILEA